jgi:CheY-like chemotaxis protein
MGNRILVVDDEADILYMVRVILRSAGFDVSAAAGVEEAKASMTEQEPDLVLLDLRLSDGHGWDVLETMRQDGRADRIPVIILSAHLGGETDDALARGARGVVAKPFSASNLLETVQEHLATV